MKDFIFFLNTLIVILTTILHFTDKSSGALLQLVLGFFQVMIALAYTVDAFRSGGIRFKKLLVIYWLLVAAFFMLASILETSRVLMVVLPMSIACYFVYVTYIVSKTK